MSVLTVLLFALIVTLQERQKKDGEDQALGRSRGGFTTKLHLIYDQRGNPLSFILTAGGIHDATAFA